MSPHEQAEQLSTDDVVRLLERNVELERQLDWFKRQLFGRKSEKLLSLDTSSQPTLGEGLLPEAQSPTDETTPVEAYARRRSGPSREPGEPRLRFDDDLPVEEIVVEDDSLEGLDPDTYALVDYKVSYRLLQNPATYQIVKVLRPVVKMKANGRFSCPPLPAEVFEGSCADASFLAGLAIDKCRYHLPLYRQHQRLTASGIHLDRGTLTRYMQRMAEHLAPIVQCQLGSILQSRVLAIDETPIKAGRQAKGKMKQSYIWPVLGDRSEIVFHFARSRGQKVLGPLLQGFAGTLVNDGYAAYESYCSVNEGVVRAQCWVHARRQFVHAEAVEPELSHEALRQIAKLYEMEGSLQEVATLEQLQELRTEQVRPSVDAFFGWLREQLDKRALLPSNPFDQAANYALAREEAMRVFLEDPRVPMDTNHLEREIRPIAVGRKNWLFCWKEAGARQLSVLYSLIATCRLQGVDPYAYLVDVLQRVNTHPARRVHELTPRLWKERFADDPLPSLMDMVQEKQRAESKA